MLKIYTFLESLSLLSHSEQMRHIFLTEPTPFCDCMDGRLKAEASAKIGC